MEHIQFNSRKVQITTIFLSQLQRIAFERLSWPIIHGVEKLNARIVHSSKLDRLDVRGRGF
jgi:uncharacterized protein Smg (DUF494 family)